jgi:hypothetical protein
VAAVGQHRRIGAVVARVRLEIGGAVEFAAGATDIAERQLSAAERAGTQRRRMPAPVGAWYPAWHTASGPVAPSSSVAGAGPHRDDAAEGVAPVQRGSGPAQDLDPLEERQVDEAAPESE